MVVRISADSTRKPSPINGAGRYEARLADGGWVVFDTKTDGIALERGRPLQGLTKVRARHLAEKLNGTHV